jgi:putative membrane protein
MLPTLALLHGGDFAWTRFDIHSSTLLGCLLLAAAYGHVVVRWRPEGEPPVPRAQIASFAGGTLVLFLSLNGPLHELSDNFLFSAHMVQHLIITLIVPPLWLMGLPQWSLRPLLRRHAAYACARAVTGPLVAFALYNVTFIGWHFPAAYNGALVNHDLHILQHIMFIGASLLMWWPVVSPVPALERLQTPTRILYLFALGIPMSIVSAIITLAGHALYPWYEAAPRVFELTALDDQQLGGLIMWVPGMLVFWIAITIIFFRWSRREEREEWRERALLQARG